MELSPKQQVVDILKTSQRILILSHKNPDGDCVGSLLALTLTLKKMGKEVTTVCADAPSAVFDYMPDTKLIENVFTGNRDFVISLETKDIQAQKIMYKTVGDKLDIIITPKNGKFTSEMLSSSDGGFHYDAVIALDCTDIERIGAPYEQNPQIFFEVPVVNIDHHAGNDFFGKINLVDMTATSTAEILVSLIESLSGDAKFIDEEIATALLTGIITDTNSFQNTNTTPKSLTVAAQLVASGARQQDIIKYIYKTRPLSTLKLWGRALTNLSEEKTANFVWTTLSAQDFTDVGALASESAGVIDELLKTASGVDFVLLLSEKNNELHGSLRSISKSKDVSEIAKIFGGGGHPMAAAFQINGQTLATAQADIIQKIVEFQKNLPKS